MSYYFQDYEIKYPEIVMEILQYFNVYDSSIDSPDCKSVMKFCEQYKKGDEYIYQPQIVSRICKRLCESGLMECLRYQGGLGINDNYLFIPNESVWYRDKDCLKYCVNSIVYGFDYIYEIYRSLVIPFVWEKENGDYAAGTGFKFSNGIVTAKHCITDVKNLQIKGFQGEDLEGKPVYVSDNEGVDIAFIETGEFSNPMLFEEEGEVMQEVLVMGYPKIPVFTDFLTAEKATISSKASSRITPTKGAIAAFGNEYLAGIDAMLITARIRGGNSGGPVINQNGSVVGVACQVPNCDPSNGDYDDLGYGIAVPMKYVTDIIKRKPLKLTIPAGFYRDFE